MRNDFSDGLMAGYRVLGFLTPFILVGLTIYSFYRFFTS